MLDAMSGDAFLLVDSDDRIAPGFVEECADGLRANPELVAVSTWTEFFGAYQGVEARAPFDAMSGWDENPIISTCALIDMSVRDEGVRFSPDLAWIYCEDWEFWAKILAAGGRFGLIPKPLAFHRAAPATGGGYRRTELSYRVGRARARRYLSSVLADEFIP
jgi:GT2 family glycosyltransferase